MNQFLLQSDLAKELYKEIKDLPIIDYHNHLDPKEIYENKPYTNITNIWLDHDHYKWRLMRNSGIDESYITGDADNLKKFKAYIKSLEHAYLNPLYHWTQMELNTYFNEETIISSTNAESMYQSINASLQDNPRGPRDFLDEMNVELVCTTDDLTDSLEYHKKIKDSDLKIRVLPTFRPDRIFATQDIFLELIHELGGVESLKLFKQAIVRRLDYFVELGCSLTDHGLTNFFFTDKGNAEEVFKKKLNNETVTCDEEDCYNTHMLSFLMKEYQKRGLTVQLHIGALRNQNKVMFDKHGKDFGYDSVSSYDYIEDLNQLFSHIRETSELPRIIIYNLHPKDNEAIASLCGNFSETKGQIQLGAPWWFNDHYNGIRKHLSVFSEYLNISTFNGMLTDSRSYLSFVRHDYFRRILANFFAQNMLLGLIPQDKESIVKVLKDISYNNPLKMF